MNPVDLQAMAEPETLAMYGVSADNADLLRPGDSLIEKHIIRLRQERAEKLLGAAGTMEPADFKRAVMDAMDVLEGKAIGAG